MNPTHDLMKTMFSLRKKIHHLQLSESMSQSVFLTLKMIHHYSEEMILSNQSVKAMKVNDIFRKAHVSRAMISKVLKECDMKGYLIIYVSEQDKRHKMVALSNEGILAMERAEREVAESIQWIESQFTLEERTMARTLLDKTDNVLERFREKNSCCD